MWIVTMNGEERRIQGWSVGPRASATSWHARCVRDMRCVVITTGEMKNTVGGIIYNFESMMF